MKKLIILLSLLFVPLSVYAGMRIINGAILGGRAGTPPATTSTTTTALIPDIFNETFNTAVGADNVWTTAATDDAANPAITYDEATAYSGQGCLLSMTTSGVNNYNQITSTFATAVGATQASYTRIRALFSSTWGASSQNITNLEIKNTSNQRVFLITARKTGSLIDIIITDYQSNTSTVSGFSVSPNWHTILVYHPNDGSNYMQYKIDGSAATELNDKGVIPTRDPGKSVVGEYAVSTTTDIYIDDIAVSTTAEAIGW